MSLSSTTPRDGRIRDAYRRRYSSHHVRRGDCPAPARRRAGQVDEYGTHVFAKDEVTILGTTWRIRNTECGWKIEEDDGGWKPRAITYNGYYKENCGACTGSCKTIDALTTDEVYGDNGETDASEPLSGVSLTLVAA